jgi:hypothetical protein
MRQRGNVLQPASEHQCSLLHSRSFVGKAKRPLYRSAYGHGANGWIMPYVTVSVLNITVFIIERQASFEMLIRFQMKAAYPLGWSCRVMSLQSDFTIVKLAGNPK